MMVEVQFIHFSLSIMSWSNNMVEEVWEEADNPRQLILLMCWLSQTNFHYITEDKHTPIADLLRLEVKLMDWQEEEGWDLSTWILNFVFYYFLQSTDACILLKQSMPSLVPTIANEWSCRQVRQSLFFLLSPESLIHQPLDH